MSECNVENVHVVEKRSIQVAKASMTAQEASGQGASHHGWLLHPRKKKAWKRTNADSFRLWHGSIGFSGGCGCRERLHNCNGVTIMVQDGTTTKKWFVSILSDKTKNERAKRDGWEHLRLAIISGSCDDEKKDARDARWHQMTNGSIINPLFPSSPHRLSTSSVLAHCTKKVIMGLFEAGRAGLQRILQAILPTSSDGTEVQSSNATAVNVRWAGKSAVTFLIVLVYNVYIVIDLIVVLTFVCSYLAWHRVMGANNSPVIEREQRL